MFNKNLQDLVPAMRSHKEDDPTMTLEPHPRNVSPLTSSFTAGSTASCISLILTPLSLPYKGHCDHTGTCGESRVFPISGHRKGCEVLPGASGKTCLVTAAAGNFESHLTSFPKSPPNSHWSFTLSPGSVAVTHMLLHDTTARPYGTHNLQLLFRHHLAP